MAEENKKINCSQTIRSLLNALSIYGFVCLIISFILMFIFNLNEKVLLYLGGIDVMTYMIGGIIFYFGRKKPEIRAFNSRIKETSYILAVTYMILELIPKLETIWCRLVVGLLILGVIWYCIEKFKKFLLYKNQETLKFISICMDIIESAIFYLVIETIILAIIVSLFHINGIINNWVPIFIISGALTIIVFEYWSILINVKAILIYIFLWIIIPIIIFVFYVQNCITGGYNTFHFLFLILAALDSFALATFSNEMQTLVGKKIHDKDGFIAITKIVLANVTLLVAIATGIFEKNRLKNFIFWICSYFYRISKNWHINLNFSINGKMTMFISITLFFIILLSFLLIFLEKKFLNWGINKLTKHGFID
ncbi:hypothetical protein [Lactobacillus intestinalis]|uniref:Uncharacterized protein n=1 Tax=Lactobacillus intestinalis DSM 6629 TaxID=1423761 RepID=A0ABR5PMU7_9LACO|nr:hypothetical protein [Lactobacillus intestinalis]KRM31315.1 hypothetical protein FC44_GL000550 [Lactobacillus intestinalis DSM 6629]UTW40129.1 hypothetical protein KBW87_07020 [Lactobacillus intestinalis]